MRTIYELNNEWMALLFPAELTAPEFITIMHRSCGDLQHLSSDELYIIICKKCNTLMPSNLGNVLRSLITLEKIAGLNIRL